MAILVRLSALRPRAHVPGGLQRRQGGVSDYGFGIQTDFLGLPLHFEFAKQWDFKTSVADFEGKKGFRFLFFIGPDF